MASQPSHPSMLPRFEGADGKQRLADVLRQQTLIGGDTALAQELANKALLMEVNPNEAIITQGGVDNDIYFIISDN